MNVIRYVITTSISILTLSLHLIGCYLLWKTFNWRNVTTQQLLIFNICICECFINCDWLVIYVLEGCGFGYDSQYFGYSFVIHLSLNGILYMVMMFMTLDRLSAVVLSLKYPQYWTVQRTKRFFEDHMDYWRLRPCLFCHFCQVSWTLVS